MCIKKCSLFLFLLLHLSPAFAVPCAQPNEMQAIRVRALQTELMIAGLSCNGQAHYNYFITNYQLQLKTYADAMRSYFKRSYGPTAELEMNEFVTQLANESATRSIKRQHAPRCFLRLPRRNSGVPIGFICRKEFQRDGSAVHAPHLSLAPMDHAHL